MRTAFIPVLAAAVPAPTAGSMTPAATFVIRRPGGRVCNNVDGWFLAHV